MKNKLLENIKPLIFSAPHVAETLGIKESSAKLACHRYARSGEFIRLKRNAYIRNNEWLRLDNAGRYKIANQLQVPSYVSFLTALAHHDATTQMPGTLIESAAIQRTKTFQIENFEFRYLKLRRDLYFGFMRREGCFIATPEKALLDSVYLSLMGRYYVDASALDRGKIDFSGLVRLAKRFPKAVQNKARDLWRN